MSTTFPRRSDTVNGCELSHPVAPPREGIALSMGNLGCIAASKSCLTFMMNAFHQVGCGGDCVLRVSLLSFVHSSRPHDANGRRATTCHDELHPHLRYRLAVFWLVALSSILLTSLGSGLSRLAWPTSSMVSIPTSAPFSVTGSALRPLFCSMRSPSSKRSAREETVGTFVFIRSRTLEYLSGEWAAVMISSRVSMATRFPLSSKTGKSSW